MTLHLIHTSDWQIGKDFRFVDNATMGLLGIDADRVLVKNLAKAQQYYGLLRQEQRRVVAGL
jgi:hypothetical protein